MGLEASGTGLAESATELAASAAGLAASAMGPAASAMGLAESATSRTTYRGRYAPSPTGWLHLGNARTALLAWVRCRAASGSFVMRVEDLDVPRTKPEAVSGNLDELRWLGLDWDEGPDVGGAHAPYLQSQRGELYQSVLERLQATGRVFECYLSRRDASEAASAPHGALAARGSIAAGAVGRGAASEAVGVYGPQQRALNARLGPVRRVAGKAFSLRYAVGEGVVAFSDALAGPQRFDLAREVGDFVLRRSDALWAYQLAVVVDDAAMGVTEVVRGGDLLASTAAQLALFEGLELQPPGYAHVPVLLDEGGERMAKRRGSLTLQELRLAGVSPERVVGALAVTLGWLERPEEVATAEVLAAFAASAVPTAPSAPARLDRKLLDWLLA